MPLVLNEEQRMFKDTAKTFFTENAPVEALRKLRDSKDATGYSTALWQQMVELGLAGITIPEAYGGLAFGFLGLGAVMEESGRNLSASPLFSTVVLGASAIELAGSEGQKDALLPAIASGEKTLALAIDEGNHHQPKNIALSATKTDEGYVLSGSKAFVLDGHSADLLIIAARTDGNKGDTGGLSLFLVDPSSNGITRSRRIMADSRNVAQIDLDHVKVSPESLLGEENHAWPVLEQVLDRGRAAIAAEMLGGTLECFERTLEYLKEREQFGVKIGSFQALKHRAAQMYADIEMTKSAVMDALTAVDENRPDSAQAVSLAKTRVNDVFTHVTNEAVQMHGGIGVTDELEIGFFLKRSRVANQILGDASYHRDRYASLNGF